jgi:hypothetical protein
MMRILLAVAALARVAHADAKHDVEELVRQHLATITDDKAPAPAIAPGLVLIIPVHFSRNLTANFYGLTASHVVQKLGPLTISVDPATHVAFFHGTVEASYVATVCADGCVGSAPAHDERQNKPWRLSGIALDDGGWKLAAIMWAEVVKDKDLMKHVDPDATKAAPSESGDAAIVKTVEDWFASGKLADGQSKRAIAASGTAPTEIALSATAAGKLARSWDGLKLWPSKVDVTTFAKGAIAFVHADVWIPAKPKGGVKLELGAILVPEAGGWRWVSLDFKADDNPAH